MLHYIKYPAWSQAASLLERPSGDLSAYREKAAVILSAVKTEGDAAVKRFAEQFDGGVPDAFGVGSTEMTAAAALLSADLRAAIRQAYSNIYAFHKTQETPVTTVETMPGVTCWRKNTPIERIGLYIPGGTAPLFSTVLMLGIPAQIAGCQTVVLCTPPQKNGAVHPAVLFAAQLCGISLVYKIGGIQAIGAMAYGTKTVPRVWKIFGPGNAWVTAAKQLVNLDGVAIDMPAGPSEVAVIADASANPAFVAADLLSQAEHGADSQVLLVSDCEELLLDVMAALPNQLSNLPRSAYAAAALSQSRVLLVKNLEEGMAWINAYAPEHLIIATQNPEQWSDKVINAGSVFLGHLTPESAGDYASGTNHTLPTSGYARVHAGVSLDSFVKKITFQKITPGGLLQVGPTVMAMAEAEGLQAHAEAVRIRLDNMPEVTDSHMDTEDEIGKLLRPNIRVLQPYRSARDEKPADGSVDFDVFLDANENSLGSPAGGLYHRYPDTYPLPLRDQLAAQKGVDARQIFIGNGSDEAIDLLIRAFCQPGSDNIVIMPPTYGMYAVQANIHGVEVREVPLFPDFSPDADAVLQVADSRSKILFICSPNNPTGNIMPASFIAQMLDQFPGIVVVDEAYIDFSSTPSLVSKTAENSRLVVLQTLSKAWGLAGLRLGMAYSNTFIVSVLNKIKYPYNINIATAELAVRALSETTVFEAHLQLLRSEKERLSAALEQCAVVEKVFHSAANFLLVRVKNAGAVWQNLIQKGIIVRNRTKELHCSNCIRITIGTPAENDQLIRVLKDLAQGVT